MDDALAITTGISLDRLFVEGEQPAVAHHDAAFDDHDAYVAAAIVCGVVLNK